MSDSESDDIDCESESSVEEEAPKTREALVTTLVEKELEQTATPTTVVAETSEPTTSSALNESTESTKEAPRKKHKEDFVWEEDTIGNGAFGEVC